MSLDGSHLTSSLDLCSSPLHGYGPFGGDGSSTTKENNRNKLLSLNLFLSLASASRRSFLFEFEEIFKFASRSELYSTRSESALGNTETLGLQNRLKLLD